LNIAILLHLPLAPQISCLHNGGSTPRRLQDIFFRCAIALPPPEENLLTGVPDMHPDLS
jgi:hypothetical protein